MPRFTGTGIGPGQPQVRCQGGVKDVRVLAHSPITVRTASAWRAVMPTPPGMAFPAVGSTNRSSTMASVVLPDSLWPAG